MLYGTVASMEATSASWCATSRVELPALFSDLVRLETELWDRVDHRLRHDHDLPLSWFEPMQVMDRVPDCRVADIAKALSITLRGTSTLVARLPPSASMHSRRPCATCDSTSPTERRAPHD